MSFTLPPIVLRTSLGRPLSWAEADGNMTALRDFCNGIGTLFKDDGTIDPDLLKTIMLNYIATSFIGSTSGYLAPVGNTIWVPKELDSNFAFPDNGASWLLLDGSKYLQSVYPKLFSFLGHDFDGNSKLQGVTVAAGGTGYHVGDILTVSGGVGLPAKLTVTTIAAGVITGLSVTNRGNYSSSPTTPNAVTGGNGTGASINLTFGDTVDNVTEFRVPDMTGAFPFGADETIVSGTIGGEKNHRLIPAEQGNIQWQVKTDDGDTQQGAQTSIDELKINGTTQNAGAISGGGSETQGSLQTVPLMDTAVAHNNMPPYRAGLFYILAGYRVNGGWI